MIMSKAKYLLLAYILTPILLLFLGSQIGFSLGALLFSPMGIVFFLIHVPLTLLVSDHIKNEPIQDPIGTRAYWILFTLLTDFVSILAYWLFNYGLKQKHN